MKTSEPQALYPQSVKPSARPLPLLPFVFRFVRNPLRSLPRSVYEEPIVTYGKRRVLAAWVTDPELTERILLKESDKFPKTRLDRRVLKPVLGDGLLNAEGASWRWQRKLASPLFRHAELLRYVPTMVNAAAEQLARWQAAGPQPTSDVAADMTETTFAVIARTVLEGIDESEADAVKQAGHEYLDPISWEVASALLQLPESLWHPGKKRMRDAALKERAAVQRLLDVRRQTGIDGNDLVARMLRAEKPDGGGRMNDQEIIDNLATFLLAGHETTAKALTWTLYLLARAPEWQERIRKEIADVAGGQPISAAQLNELDITRRFLKESMRIFPPVPVMTRVAAEDVQLGPVELKSPTLIVLPIYAIHRHQKLWNDAGRFDPDRFLPDNEENIPRTQFMPFGFGQRVCIGASFAQMEALAILATLVANTSFTWDGKWMPEPVSRVTLRPKGGMPLQITML